MSDQQILHRPLDLVSIGVIPQSRNYQANEEERAKIADALSLVDLPALDAEIELHRDGRGRIHVEGRITADIVQSCVVSFEPVAQHIDEPISRTFFEGEPSAEEQPRPGAEIRIDPGDDDPPEVLTGATLDLGPIIMEHFVLAIDPYPRAPGAELPAKGIEGSDSPDSPFAILAKLKEKPRGK